MVGTSGMGVGSGRVPIPGGPECSAEKVCPVYFAPWLFSAGPGRYWL